MTDTAVKTETMAWCAVCRLPVRQPHACPPRTVVVKIRNREIKI